ncbi:VIR protein [Plasmodium vivax]|uniref:VIR protein n=1 Tax=Plasmodium vivax TaxID=5855 RepID=A0A1G4GX50_PLAVI|nr:VIR protein [Plasmodium vivax]
MSESKREVAFDIDGFITKSSFLHDSELYKFYKTLDDATPQTHECSTDCLRNKEYEVCELNCHLENIFRKEKNICSSNENIQQKCCDYINYWLYDKLEKKGIDLFGIVSIYRKLTHPLKKDQPPIINNPCRDKFKHDTSLEVLKNRKILYDFSENYDYIKNELSRVSQNNKEICEYTKYIIKLYNKLNEEDKVRGLSHRYEKELDSFKNKINKNSELTLLKSKCDIDDSLLKPFENVETSNLLQEDQEKNVTRHTNSSSDIEILNNIKTETDSKLTQSPSYLIYNELGKTYNSTTYNITRCDAISNSTEEVKTICKKIVRNLNELRTLDKVKNESLKDRCTYLNFWIYGELSKLYNNNKNYKDKDIFDLPEAAKLLRAGIEINNDLITEDLNNNLKSKVWSKEPKIIRLPPEGEGSSAPNGTSASLEMPANKTSTGIPTSPSPIINLANLAPSPSNSSLVSPTSNGKKEPFNIISYKELRNYEPCFFIYNCKFSECIEMKYLYEYFKNYKYIKKEIKCDNKNRRNFVQYLENISILYNKHKEEEECCSWGETMCPDYFLDCDESYDPKKLLSAIESDEQTCNEIKSKAGIANTTEVTFDNAKLDKNMYIKYMTCSYVTDPIFKKKSLRCQQPAYSPHLNNKYSHVRPVNMEQTDVSELKGKELTFSGNSVKAFLISNPKLKITGQTENATTPRISEFTTGKHYTLFPEVTGKARNDYLKEGERPCTNKPGEEMSEFCKRSKQYTDIINQAILPPEKLIEEAQVQTVEDNVVPEDDNVFPVDFSSLNEILKNLPFRIGVVILAALGTLAMLFLYYKFTPLGAWLQNILGRKQKINRNMHREANRMALKYAEEYVPQNMPKKRIQIAYQNSR